MGFLDDLPKRDHTHDTAQAAESAFQSAIDGARHFVVQQKDRNDYGTDVQIEARDDGGMTNLRVHVQLKGTEAAPNADGSVSVGDISRTNLNYLLAQPDSIYACSSGQCTLSTGVVRSLAVLGSLKTEFGQLDTIPPPPTSGAQKFRVAQVLPALRRLSDGGDLLRRIEAFLQMKESDIEYNVTVMRVEKDLIVKDGNARSIAFCERRKNTAEPFAYPVFLVEIVDRVLKWGHFCAQKRATLRGHGNREEEPVLGLAAKPVARARAQ